jgi:hypothetical protein
MLLILLVFYCCVAVLRCCCAAMLVQLVEELASATRSVEALKTSLQTKEVGAATLEQPLTPWFCSILSWPTLVVLDYFVLCCPVLFCVVPGLHCVHSRVPALLIILCVHQRRSSKALHSYFRCILPLSGRPLWKLWTMRMLCLRKQQ